MNKAEAFFQTLELVPNAIWHKEEKGKPSSGSRIMIGEIYAATCRMNLGKYYIMSSKELFTEISTRYVVNTESKEVRILPSTHKIKDIEIILRP